MSERTTRQLVDDLWDALVPAWLGASFAAIATALAAVFVATGFWLGAALCAGVMFSGVYCAVPWFHIRAELRRRRGE